MPRYGEKKKCYKCGTLLFLPAWKVCEKCSSSKNKKKKDAWEKRIERVKNDFEMNKNKEKDNFDEETLNQLKKEHAQMCFEQRMKHEKAIADYHTYLHPKLRNTTVL